MISYDRYENKIKKFAKFRDFLKRFKFLFLSLFALILGAISTLLALKGSFSGAIKISSSTYGEGYADPEGVSAFLSTVAYEYSKEGSGEWKQEKPVKAGKYFVRAVSNRAVGKGYGAETSFEIAPLEVEFSIASTSVEYGGVPSNISLNLLAGDELDRSALLFRYDDYAAQKTNVDLDASSVKITNGGDDRSSCYIVKHEGKKLTITPRPISVSLKEEKFVYSGSAFSHSKTVSAGTAMRLANGDIIEITKVELQQGGAEIESAVNAGGYKAVVQEFCIYKVVNGEKIDVTGHYSSEQTPTVDFVIEKKPIVVKTASEQKDYDGTPLAKADGYQVTGLIEGTKLRVLESRAITNAQTAKNEFLSYEIENEEGADLRRNYSISWEYGTLVVNKRKITVSSPDESWVYSGVAQSRATISLTDELFEAEADAFPATRITTVGTRQNVVNFALKSKATGATQDMTNFDITTNWGKLEITRLPVRITIESLSKVYDGTALSASATRGEAKVTDGALASGDFLADGALDSLVDVYLVNGVLGQKSNSSEYKIFVAGGEDRTNCYEIEYERGTLEVTPRHVTLKTNSAVFEYDSKPHLDAGCKIYIEGVESELVAGNTLSLIGSAPAFTNVAETKDASENNVCAYDAGKNYVIDGTSYGTIRITKRGLKVTSSSDSFVYDGNDHSNSDYLATTEDDAEGLLNGDKLIVVSYTRVNGATSINNNNVCVYDVPNENYEIISTAYGTLRVLPRAVKITSPTQNWIYDGKEHSKAEVSIEDVGELFNVVAKGVLTTVKDKTNSPVPNKVEYAIVNGAGEEEYGSNFNVTEVWGELSVSARRITLTSPDEEWVYDGQAHAKAEISCTDELFTAVASEPIKTEIVDFGTIENAVNYSVVMRETGATESNLSNFAITEEWGTLRIASRPIVVYTASESKIYDGAPLSKNEYRDTSYTDGENRRLSGLLNGDTLALLRGYSITNVKESGENRCEFSVPNENYKIIKYEYGTLTVNPKPITIEISDVPVVYGEEYFYPSGGGNFSNKESCGFVGDDMAEISVRLDLSKFSLTGNRIPVRWVDNKITGYEGAIVQTQTIFVSGDSTNYTLSYEAGALIVQRRVLNVGMKNVQTFYGEDIYLPNGDSAIYPSGAGNVGNVYFYALDGVTIVRDEDGRPRAGLLAGDTIEVTSIKYWDKEILDPSAPPDITEEQGDEHMVENFVTPKNADNYRIKPYEIKIYCADGTTETTRDENDGDPVGANYSIIYYTAGVLQIMKRPVKLTFNTIESTYYDGLARSYSAGNEEIVRGEAKSEQAALLKKTDGLCYGDKFSVSVILSQLVFDEALGKNVYVPITPVFAGKYVYYLDVDNSFFESLNEGGSYENVGLKNYSIDYDDGVFEITKRPITIKMCDLELSYGEYPDKTYAGATHTITSELQLVSGDYVSAIKKIDFGCGSRPSVGTYTIRGSDAAILTRDNVEASSSYAITYDTGKFYVTTKAVQILLSKKTVLYGEDYRGFGMQIISPLAYDETCTLSLTYFSNDVEITPRNVGVYDIKITPELSVGNGGLSNYAISYANLDTRAPIENALFVGGLEITPLPVTVSVDSKSVIYGEKIGEILISRSPELPYPDEKLNVTFRFEKGGAGVTPKYAGTYDIVIEKLLINDGEEGLRNYAFTSNHGALKITPREISITLDSLTLTYGEIVQYAGGNNGTNYTIASGTLVYGDELFVTPDFELTGTSRTRPDCGNYRILEGEIGVRQGGAESVGDYLVKDSYTIQIKEGELTVNPRKITVTLNEIFPSPSHYDGAEHPYVAGGETIGGEGMAEGENLIVAVKYLSASQNYGQVPAIAKAGLYRYEFDYDQSSVENGGNKGIKNYVVAPVGRDCEILKRQIKVRANTIETQYYGSTVVYPIGEGNNCTIVAGELVAGEKIQIVVVFENTESKEQLPDNSVLPVGTYEIKRDTSKFPVVTGGTYADYGNYSIVTYESSTFKVEQREIKITLNDVTTDYGTQPVYNVAVGNYANVETLMEGETLTVAEVKFEFPESSARPVVGEYPDAIKLVSVRIMRNGKDVSQYFKVDTVCGKVTVLQRRVIVKTAETSFLYDGQSHSDPQYEIYYAVDYEKGTKGLAYDDKSEVVTTSFPSVTEYSESTTENSFIVKIKDKDGNDSVAGNYIIEYKYGALSITRRRIFITTESISKVYDGTPLTNRDQFKTLEGDGLVSGQQFTYKTISFTTVQKRQNDNFVDIVDQNNVSKKHNYEITMTLGNLEIKVRNVYVGSSGKSKVYDGEELRSPDDNYTLRFYPDNDTTNTPLTGEANVLGEGDSFVLKTPSIINVGRIENNIYGKIVRGGEDRTGNYKVIFEGGYLEVTPRSVSYSLNATPRELTYWGSGDPSAQPEYSAPEYSLQAEDSVNNEGVLQKDKALLIQKLKFIYLLNGNKVSRFNAGEYVIDLNFDGFDSKDNYKFTCMQTGTLIINRKDLLLTVTGKSENYKSADQTISVTTDNVVVTGLVSSDRVENVVLDRESLSAKEGKEFVNVKVIKSEIAIKSNDTFENLANNYKIMSLPGQLRFIRRTLYFEQIVPVEIRNESKSGRGELPYTGVKREFFGEVYKILDVSGDNCGLLVSDRAELKSASVSAQPSVYAQWVQLSVINSQGTSVSSLYNIVPLSPSGRDTSIEVLPVRATITFGANLTQSYLDGLEYGRTLLDASFIASVTGLWNEGDASRVGAAVDKREDGSITIYVYLYRYQIYTIEAVYLSGISPRTVLTPYL